MRHSPLTALISDSNAGFTIIEVLIAIAIFSIGIMAMGALQSASLMATGNIAEKTEAWAILDDQAERLKALPFYLSVAGTKNDDGSIDAVTAMPPDMVAGNRQVNTPDGRYTVHWQVVDNQPIPAVVVTGANPVLPEVPAGTYMVSKTVSVQVTLSRPGHNNPLNRNQALATVQFVKTWAADGIP